MGYCGESSLFRLKENSYPQSMLKSGGIGFPWTEVGSFDRDENLAQRRAYTKCQLASSLPLLMSPRGPQFAVINSAGEPANRFGSDHKSFPSRLVASYRTARNR